jgi:uncharacterized protein DUF3892
MAIRITCINKDGGNHENPHVAISYLGWVEDGTGKTDKSTRLQIYDWLKTGGGQAYVQDTYGNRAQVVPRETIFGTKYVQTVRDNTPTDNLLHLMECR